MSILSKIFSRSAAQPLSRSAALASIAFALLTACSGGSPDLSTGIAPTTKSVDFGKPASSEAVKNTSQQLASYFNGQHASNPQALMGTQGAQNAKATSASSTGTGKLAVAATNVRQNIFRFYNTATQVHFYTMSVSERDYVKTNLSAFRDEGIGFFAYPAADPVLSPVHRFYNTVTGGHFYTINPAEKDHVIATWPAIFNYEGIAWYASTASAANLMPIYRFFNTKTGAHFYTSSASERDHVLATWNWFTFEGIAYYVGETAVDPVVPPVVPPVLPDTTAPVITVLGENPFNLSAGTAYTEAGATCVDNKDATCTVVTTGTVNTATPGAYTITYSATDAAGNTSSKTRAVTVAACTAAATGSTGYSLVFKGCSAANVAEYYDKTECVRDNATGLIWQGQTPAGTGLRANDQYKTNFDNTTELQKYVSATNSFVAVTQAEIDAPTNSIGFKNAVNTSNLCDSGAWRLPTKDELLGIVKTAEVPTIDNAWFPNTVGWIYWTSLPFNSPYTARGANTWCVIFNTGSAGTCYRSGAYTYTGNLGLVRLVR